MTDYLLPEGMTPAAAARALAESLELRGGRSGEVDRIYYDSFDGLLYDQGLQAVWEDESLCLLERRTDAVRARLPLSRPGAPLRVQDLAPSAMADALRPLVDVRALLPIAEVRCREQLLDVLNSERKTVARVRLQSPALGSRSLHSRVHLVGIRGYDRALERLSQTMALQFGFQPAELPLVDEAVIAAGGAPGGISSKVRVPLVYGQRSDRAAVAVLTALLEIVEANMGGTITDLDSEFLHDLRVSVRRSRAVQREFKGVFEREGLEIFRAGFRWLQQSTGDLRDLDVYLLEFPGMAARVPDALRPDLDLLREVQLRRRTAARQKTTAALRSRRTSALLSDWRAFLEGVEASDDRRRPDGSRPIGELTGQRIRKVYRRMAEMGAAIGPASPSESYHELRKKGKELRYLLELFGAPLYPEESVKPMVRVLKDLQDVLGRHQDREVQIATLRGLAREVAPEPGGTDAVMAMGALVDRLDEDRLAARAAFAQRFAAFAAGSQQRVVREAFG